MIGPQAKKNTKPSIWKENADKDAAILITCVAFMYTHVSLYIVGIY